MRARILAALEPLANGSYVVTPYRASTTFTPGQPIPIQVTLSQGGPTINGEHISGGTPISNALVRAAVLIPGRILADTITIVSKGYGVYAANYTNTAAPGTYRFTVNASGTVTLQTALTPVQVTFFPVGATFPEVAPSLPLCVPDQV